MALSPKEMENAIIRNLPEKTGKSLEEWMKMCIESGPASKKELLTWLKTSMGLGHGQAQVVIRRLENNNNNEYEQEEKLVSELFSCENEGLYELYETVSKEVMKLGSDIKVKPCKTYVPFYRNKQFLIVKPEGDLLYIGMALNGESDSTLLTKAKGLGGSDRINKQLGIRSGRDITSEVLGLIKKAYDEN
ncbi:MAG: DUF5655 domain-containing protein [Bacillota bacterium]